MECGVAREGAAEREHFSLEPNLSHEEGAETTEIR
jgi:hypothetical protein